MPGIHYTFPFPDFSSSLPACLPASIFSFLESAFRRLRRFLGLMPSHLPSPSRELETRVVTSDSRAYSPRLIPARHAAPPSQGTWTVNSEGRPFAIQELQHFRCNPLIARCLLLGFAVLQAQFFFPVGFTNWFNNSTHSQT